jgi:hypothetical protein
LKKIIHFALLVFFFSSCQEKELPSISFYYWKTIFELSPKEKEAISINCVKRVYVRYFDIDIDSKNQKPFPRTPIRFVDSVFNFEVVPVIYIKNSVFLSKQVNLLDLVQKTNQLIEQINTKNKISTNEIQLDCDWTLLSKDNYMHFVALFKKTSNKKLSATIRLHQIKYFKKTEIPNVDYGVLMYYNMGKIAADSLNSIYDQSIANRYLASLKKYPLPINIALPIYSWGIHIRDGKIIGLRNKINIHNLKNNSSFVLTNEKWIIVKRSTFQNGVFYKENDQLKIENVSGDDLIQMSNDINSNTTEKPREIIFYDLDEFNLVRYDTALFKKVIDCY